MAFRISDRRWATAVTTIEMAPLHQGCLRSDLQPAMTTLQCFIIIGPVRPVSGHVHPHADGLARRVRLSLTACGV